jgi:hypothetical protein
MSCTILLPFHPDVMTPAQLTAVSYLARYSGHTTSCTPTSCAAGSTGVTPRTRPAGWYPARTRGDVHLAPRRDYRRFTARVILRHRQPRVSAPVRQVERGAREHHAGDGWPQPSDVARAVSLLEQLESARNVAIDLLSGSSPSQARYSGPSRAHQPGQPLAKAYPSREVMKSTTSSGMATPPAVQ